MSCRIKIISVFTVCAAGILGEDRECRKNEIIQGIPCKPGEWVFFHKNGKLEFAALPVNTVIQGLPVKAGHIRFHENSRLQKSSLSQRIQRFRKFQFSQIRQFIFMKTEN